MHSYPTSGFHLPVHVTAVRMEGVLADKCIYDRVMSLQAGRGVLRFDDRHYLQPALRFDDAFDFREGRFVTQVGSSMVVVDRGVAAVCMIASDVPQNGKPLVSNDLRSSWMVPCDTSHAELEVFRYALDPFGDLSVMLRLAFRLLFEVLCEPWKI